MISLCGEMYCCAEIRDEDVKLSCEWIQKNGVDAKFYNVLFDLHEDKVLNNGMRSVNWCVYVWTTYFIAMPNIIDNLFYE
jgi:hypothetical protein